MSKIVTSNGTVLKFKPKALFWGVQQLDKKIAEENLISVKKVCDEGNVKFGLIAGTLLGAIREKDFIDYDEDIDLFVLYEDRQKIVDLLPKFIEAGFLIARVHRTGKLISIMKNKQYVDFNFFKSYDDQIRYSGGWLIIDKFLTDTDELVFKGYKYVVPRNYEDYLESEYGETWQTPIKWNDYDMPFYKRQLAIFKQELKEIFPDCIYDFFIKRAANNERQRYLRNFDAYCSKRNIEKFNFKDITEYYK